LKSVLRTTSLHDPAVSPLLAGLDEEYRRVYGAILEGEIEAHEAAEFEPPAGTFLIARVGEETVAGGGLRRWSDGIAEIKRMWTAPAHRGRGYARRVLAALEEAAGALGYRAVRLETGSFQTAALALYRSAGYRRIAPYSVYADDPRCRAFEKRLR
jgi:ribosomal protein S18 acetylase RimI-like enzyme